MIASIVIPVLDDKRVLRCVKSVLSQSLNKEDYEIIVVDNGSTEVDISEGLPITLLIEKKKGIFRAVNRGLTQATGEFLVRIDADCYATPTWLEELLKPFSDPAVGVVGGAVFKEAGTSLVEKAARNLVIGDQLEPQYLPMFYAPYVVTANAAFRCNVVKHVGGFDEQFISGGDVDISWQVFLAGYTIKCAQSAIVYHPSRPTVKKYFLQFYRYGIGHAALFRKYKQITGRKYLVNVYPFKGLLKLTLMDIPLLMFQTVYARELNHTRIMRLFLDSTEYLGLICGDVVGAFKYKIFYL